MAILTTTQLDSTCNTIVNSMAVLYPETLASYQMLYLFGLRWIEVFELTRWSQPTFDFYEVDTAKNSSNRLIPVATVPPVYKNLIQSGNNVILQFGYMSMKRYLKRYTPYPRMFSGNKNISLHIFRYNRARLMSDDGYSNQEIADYFGEVSLQNMELYIDSIIDDGL